MKTVLASTKIHHQFFICELASGAIQTINFLQHELPNVCCTLSAAGSPSVRVADSNHALGRKWMRAANGLVWTARFNRYGFRNLFLRNICGAVFNIVFNCWFTPLLATLAAWNMFTKLLTIALPIMQTAMLANMVHRMIRMCAKLSKYAASFGFRQKACNNVLVACTKLTTISLK